jgi:hypothetical protein
VPFQGKENDLKNETEMREIIRKTYYDVDKANWCLTYIILEMPCHRKCKTMACSFKCLFGNEWFECFSQKDKRNRNRNKNKNKIEIEIKIEVEVEVERRRFSIKYQQMNFLRIHKKSFNNYANS